MCRQAPSVVDGLNDAPALPASALDRVRSVQGVLSAMPLALATADARFPNGRFQAFQVTGVDNATLSGVPIPEIESAARHIRSLVLEEARLDFPSNLESFIGEEGALNTANLQTLTRQITACLARASQRATQVFQGQLATLRPDWEAWVPRLSRLSLSASSPPWKREPLSLRMPSAA